MSTPRDRWSDEEQDKECESVAREVRHLRRLEAMKQAALNRGEDWPQTDEPDREDEL